MRRALDGVRTLFFVSGRETQDRLEQHLTAVDAAGAVGVKQIVYLSFMAAAPDANFTLARQHSATEEASRATGTRHTFLRSSLYAHFVPYFTGPDGLIRGPVNGCAATRDARRPARPRRPPPRHRPAAAQG